MSVIDDPEFGEISVYTHRNATRISIKYSPNGKLRIVTPPYTPLTAIKVLLKTSRPAIRKLAKDNNLSGAYTQNQPVGKSHSLIFQEGATNIVKTTGTSIVATFKDKEDINTAKVQSEIKQAIVKALRKEAKSYLPRRLKYLAELHGFYFKSTKITHASSRWGSCSSSGTISMNISLMQLPFELLDYVLIHELCHTREMNHSTRFWSEVQQIDPQYKIHKNALKNYSPHV